MKFLNKIVHKYIFCFNKYKKKRHKKNHVFQRGLKYSITEIYLPKIYLNVNCACQTSKVDAFFWKVSFIKTLVPSANV